ncbi:MAG: alkaline phosphatase [Candidatus Aminicenantes bacterium]|nr:alkaline phosphatase [Candidatus Aminicenantes bacterium]
MMNKTWRGFHLLAIVVSLLVVSNAALEAKSEPGEKGVRNVILLIADGTGVAHLTLSRWYNGGATLAIDEWICGLLRTYGANTPLTDSAPAATAFATGFKSFTGFIGLLPQEVSMWGIDPKLSTDAEERPLVTVLEAAKLAGKATGIVVTCEIPHATPAAFSAHQDRRKDFEAIAEQQVYNGIDVVLAGGALYLEGRNRKDGEDLMAVLRQKGYCLVRNRKEMLAPLSGRVWGLFAQEEMANDLDRAATEPSLAEMTAKAISLLQRHRNGFFLMVEGSKIDWAAHDNEPVGVVSEVLAFDRAVAAALAFARRDCNTAVIVVSDHGCGGLSIGDLAVNSLKERPGLPAFIEPLRKARHTAEGVEKMLLAANDLSAGAISVLIGGEYGLALNQEELARVQAYFARRRHNQFGLAAILGPILSRVAYLGWTTDGHTGEDVPLAIFHPRGYRLSGVVQNTAVAWYIDEILNLNLREWNKILYLPALKMFAEKGANVAIEEKTPGNKVLVVSKGTQVLRLPANKNEADLDGRSIMLHSLVVYNGMAFFVPREALDLIK